MALAGDMKLKNFLALAGGAAVLLGVGTCGGLWWIGDQTSEAIQREREQRLDELANAPTPTPAPVATPSADPAPAPAPASGLSEVEQKAMSYKFKDLGADKIKDATKGKPYKINVYQDAGNKTANRLKIDLDRDEKWDEKWTFDDAGVQRQVAPSDDEVYSTVLRWDGAAWVPEG